MRREQLGDVALHVTQQSDPSKFLVAGRGVLHLSILIEKMRREGYEFAVGRPQVVLKNIDGEICEPVEIFTVDVPTEHQGPVIQELGGRRGDMVHLETHGNATTVVYHIPSRGLIGLRSKLLSLTRGYAVMQTLFKGYEPIKGEIAERKEGALISKEEGDTTGFAMFKMQDRGVLFIHPGTPVYAGMILGEHCREDDLIVNLVKGKQLTNMRTTATDENIVLTPPRPMTLEDAISWINTDEIVEMTPESIRIRARVARRRPRLARPAPVVLRQLRLALVRPHALAAGAPAPAPSVAASSAATSRPRSTSTSRRMRSPPNARTSRVREAKSLERTYGWSVAARAARASWGQGDDLDARRWARASRRSRTPSRRATSTICPARPLPDPHTGMHANSAFGLAFAIDYARAVGATVLEDACVSRALAWFAADRDVPAAWEPSGADFPGSPALMEADPDAPGGSARPLWRATRGVSSPCSTSASPPRCSRRRRSTTAPIPRSCISTASTCPARGACGDRQKRCRRATCARAVLLDAADRHLEAGLAGVESADYLGAHWLATFSECWRCPNGAEFGVATHSPGSRAAAHRQQGWTDRGEQRTSWSRSSRPSRSSA